MGFLDLNWRGAKLEEVIEGCAGHVSIIAGLQTNPEVLEMHQKRLEICHTCNINTDGVCNLYKHTIHAETKLPVLGCGCLIKCKAARAKSECPAQKWRAAGV